MLGERRILWFSSGEDGRPSIAAHYQLRALQEVGRQIVLEARLQNGTLTGADDLIDERRRALITRLSRIRSLGPPAGHRAHHYIPSSSREAIDVLERAARIMPRDWLEVSSRDSRDFPLRVVHQDLGSDEHLGRYIQGGGRSDVLIAEALIGSPKEVAVAAHELTHRMQCLIGGLSRLEWCHQALEGVPRDPRAARRQGDDPEAISEMLPRAIEALSDPDPETFRQVLGQDPRLLETTLGALACL